LKNLEAHCFHRFLNDSPTNQSESSENSELPDSSKTVKPVKIVSFQILPKTVKVAKTVLWSLNHFVMVCRVWGEGFLIFGFIGFWIGNPGIGV
jgi:hypothetical protein